jgi:hypothetical protein
MATIPPRDPGDLREGLGDHAAGTVTRITGGLTMGLLDHRRTWQYDVDAPPTECVNAFERAFSARVSLLVKAHWGVRRTDTGAVAVYKGRGGLGAASTILSKTSALEHDTALGSEVTFDTERRADARTVCTMWLSSSGRAGVAGLLGVTSDARFIRPYMQAVAREMRTLDPAMTVSTGR